MGGHSLKFSGRIACPHLSTVVTCDWLGSFQGIDGASWPYVSKGDV